MADELLDSDQAALIIRQLELTLHGALMWWPPDDCLRFNTREVTQLGDLLIRSHRGRIWEEFDVADWMTFASDLPVVKPFDAATRTYLAARLLDETQMDLADVSALLRVPAETIQLDLERAPS